MDYILKQFDNDLLYFSMENTNDGLDVKICMVNENIKGLLPLDLELTNHSLKRWLEKRTIPRNRAYVSNFLARLGLNEKDTKGIIDIYHWMIAIELLERAVRINFLEKIYIKILFIQILHLLLLLGMEVM